MPNLRVSDEESRDLATYLTQGTPDANGVPDVKDKDAPAGLVTLGELSSAQEVQLEYACRDHLEKDYTNAEVALMFAGKATAPEGKARYPEVATKEQRLQYLGKQSINRYGCFGCHFVKGMETQPGIGRELSDVGDKNLNQVDWGFVSVSRFAEKRPEGKIRENRHEWINRKVELPRCFDEGKVKAPLDRSRMPQFKTTPFEREALITYLIGNTGNRKVSEEYRYKPAVRRANVIEGEYSIQRNNCKACHLLGVDKISLVASADGKTGVLAKPLLNAKKQPLSSDISGAPLTEKTFVEGFLLLDNTDIYGKDGAAVIELFANAGNDAGPLKDKMSGDNVAVSDGSALKAIDEAKSPIVGADADLEKVIAETPADVWAASEGGEKDAKNRQLAALKKGLGWRNRGGTSLDKVIRARVTAKLGFNPWDPACKANFDCEQLPILELEDAKSFGPPHLVNESLKVQPLWLQSFLKEPIEIRPSLRPAAEWSKREITANILNAGGPKMPTYGFRDSDTQVLSRYFASVEEEQRLAKVRPQLEEIQSSVKAKEPGFKARLEIQKRVYGVLDPVSAREYYTIGIADGVFNYTPRSDVSLSRALDEKTDGFMVSKEAEKSGWYGAGYRLFVHPDVNCQKCHLMRGQLPGGTVDAWAPDLARVRERLKPDYLREWIANPKSIVPGTKMPQLLLPGKLQNVLPGDEKQQVGALVDWMMAGVPSVLEAFPKAAKVGDQVRLTSALLSLDQVKEITVQDTAGGAPQVLVEGESGFVREKSAERTAALEIKIAGGARGKTYVITVKDDRYKASVEVPVAAD